MTVVRKAILGTLGIVGGGGVAVGYVLDKTVKASDLVAHPPNYPFPHKAYFTAVDAASARRGYEVYRQVCAACHSLKFIAYRHLVGVTHSEEEMKAIAAEAMVEDGPDDDGNMFMRPGKLSDYHVGPYKNPEAAKAANGGALPPDLSLITRARRGGEDYLFSLLTGYMDPPAGIKLMDGLHFNPYFPGGQIAMARALYNELIEYSDGTPATASQMAKDICTFLVWTGEPEINERKRIAIKAFIIVGIMWVSVFYFRRQKYATLFSRQYHYIPKKR